MENLERIHNWQSSISGWNVRSFLSFPSFFLLFFTSNNDFHLFDRRAQGPDLVDTSSKLLCSGMLQKYSLTQGKKVGGFL